MPPCVSSLPFLLPHFPAQPRREGRKVGRKEARSDNYKFYNLIIVREVGLAPAQLATIFRDHSLIKSQTGTSRISSFLPPSSHTLPLLARYYLRKPMARSIDLVLSVFFFSFFPKQAILSRCCPPPPLPPPPLSPLPVGATAPSFSPADAVGSSLVIFNYRIFNRELLRLLVTAAFYFAKASRAGPALVRDGNLFILIRNNLIFTPATGRTPVRSLAGLLAIKTLPPMYIFLQ